jgi:DNA-binding IclR family transcriptional regulator
MAKIQSIQRAIQILGLFSLSTPRLGISEIARTLRMPKGTIQGLVGTLAEGGFLQRDDETRKYQLGLKIYELGVILSGSLEINQIASNPAYQLARQTQRLVRIAILDGDSALTTLDAYPRSQPFLSNQFGPRAPLYCSALGKALLAFFEKGALETYLEQTELVAYTRNTLTDRNRLLKELDDTRERGYSINREEHFIERAAIGATIFSRGKRLFASMCISGHPDQIFCEETEKLVEQLLEKAREISRLLGYFPEALISESLRKEH